MWHCHEFGERRSSQNGMIGGFEVGYLELDVLHQEILFCTKCVWERDQANLCRRISKNDVVEGRFAWSAQTHVVEAHLR